MGPTDTILKGDHQRTIPSKFSPHWSSCFRRRFFIVFPIGSYVKTMSADGGHLGWTLGPTDTILKGDHPRTIPPKFGPNWPSSFREKIFKDFLPNFLFLAMAAILVGGGVVGYNSERGPPKDHPCQVWFKLAQWFQRRRLKCN